MYRRQFGGYIWNKQRNSMSKLKRKQKFSNTKRKFSNTKRKFSNTKRKFSNTKRKFSNTNQGLSKNKFRYKTKKPKSKKT